MHPLLVLVVSMAVVIGLIVWARLHAFLALLIGAIVVGVLAPAINPAESVTLAATELGAVTGRIGIIIALASFIGLGLQQSGGAARIGAFFISLTGPKRSHYAMAASGYVLSIPVFFDTVFYLMAPLVKAMHVQARSGYSLLLMAVVAGAAATHVFVPPTPGPLAAASQLGVDLGLMILVGVLVSAIAVAGGLTYASWAFRRWPDLATHVRGEIERAAADTGTEQTGRTPSLTLAFLPIVLPIVLIAGRTVVSAMGLTGPFAAAVTFVGDPNVALFLALLATMYLLVTTRGMSRVQMAALTEEAFASAGTIILITAAGGAYGGMLTRAQIGTVLADYAAALGLPVLLLAFLLASLLKVAQGSSTVAIITSASIIAGIYAGGDPSLLPHPVYAALAAAGGSLVVSWMNDSGFWVIAKMGGLNNSETIRMWTGTAATVGTTGFLVVVLLSWILPLK
jgi:GntP family gluconate:H+ symporter